MLQLAIAQVASHVNRLLGKRIEARVVHRGGHVKRRRNEILHLVRPVTMAL